MKRSTLSTIVLLLSGFIMMVAFQNCSKVGFTESGSAAFKGEGDGRDPGVDPGGDEGRDPGLDPDDSDDREPGNDPNDDDDRDPGSDVSDLDEEEDSDWLYIPGGRGHVPMSAVAICPAGSKDEGKQKCPFFCFQGVDYTMHKSLAREYFAKHFDRQADYGGMAVPGTCASPDLKNKRND